MTFRAEVAGEEVARVEIARHWLGPGVRRSPVRDRGLAGVLYEPAGPGPHPALIVVGGSGGGLNEVVAALLASRGCAALALAYFGFGSLPKSLVEIPLEYFDTALEWLSERPSVAADRIGVVGSSRGGELSLLLAATFPRISVAVAYAPSHVVWAGFGADPSDWSKSAWTHRGTPLACLGSAGSAQAAAQHLTAMTPPTQAIAGSPSFLQRLDDGPAEEKAAIRLEDSRAAFLLISGGDDQMWPSAEFARRAIARLEAHRHARPYRHLSYPRAGHAIGMPCVPHGTEIVHPVNGWRYALGGTAEANARASSDSWPKLLEFLREHL
jgi:dienelactone hydrolase